MTSFKCLLPIAVLMIFAGNTFMAQEAKGYLQIKGNPGISIFLDEEFKGITSNDLGGLIIQNVIPGTHTIKAVKEGFQPQIDSVSVAVNEVKIFTLRPFIPKIEIEQKGKGDATNLTLGFGNVIIQSLPVEMIIDIPTIGIVQQIKTKDEWSMKKVPTGIYLAEFRALDKVLKYEINVKDGTELHIMADFVSGEITVIKESIVGFIDSRDGKSYKAVKIGNQIWMAENLAFKAEESCWVYDNNESNANKYGYLYGWKTACEVCPTGWHLPSDEEWKQLEIALGMSSKDADQKRYRGRPVGTKMKSTNGWTDNGNGTNESGFSGLPGGYRSHLGNYYNLGISSILWSSTKDSNGGIWYRALFYTDMAVGRLNNAKPSAYSVRCVKD